MGGADDSIDSTASEPLPLLPRSTARVGFLMYGRQVGVNFRRHGEMLVVGVRVGAEGRGVVDPTFPNRAGG